MNRWGDESDSSSGDDEEAEHKDEQSLARSDLPKNYPATTSESSKPDKSSLQQQSKLTSLNRHQRLPEDQQKNNSNRNRDPHNDKKSNNRKQFDRDETITGRGHNDRRGQKDRSVTHNHNPSDWRTAAKASSSLGLGSQKDVTGGMVNGNEWMANRRLKEQARIEEAAKAAVEEEEQLLQQQIKHDEEGRRRRLNQVQSLKEGMQKLELEKTKSNNQHAQHLKEHQLHANVESNATDDSNVKVSSLQAAATGFSAPKVKRPTGITTNSLAVTIEMPSGATESYNINASSLATAASTHPQRHHPRGNQNHAHSSARRQQTEANKPKVQQSIPKDVAGVSSLSRAVQETPDSTSNSHNPNNNHDRSHNRRNDESGTAGRGKKGSHHQGGRGRNSDQNVSSPKSQSKTPAPKTHKQHIVIGE